jgi:hypothetical protein
VSKWLKQQITDSTARYDTVRMQIEKVQQQRGSTQQQTASTQQQVLQKLQRAAQTVPNIPWPPQTSDTNNRLHRNHWTAQDLDCILALLTTSETCTKPCMWLDTILLPIYNISIQSNIHNSIQHSQEKLYYLLWCAKEIVQHKKEMNSKQLICYPYADLKTSDYKVCYVLKTNKQCTLHSSSANNQYNEAITWLWKQCCPEGI